MPTERFLEHLEGLFEWAQAEPATGRADLFAAARALLLRRLLHQGGAQPLIPILCGPTPALPEPLKERLTTFVGGARLRLNEPQADGCCAGGIGPEVLAAIHERSRTDRRQDGVFYTPRGEVRAMCRDALRARLAGALGWPDDSPALLQWLHGNATPDVSPATARELYRAVAGLRVLDPAAGCGDLLVGMATEMVRALRQLACRLPPEVRGRVVAEGLPDPVHEGALRAYVVSRCLFGVDVDAAAVEVCRHRLLLLALAGEESGGAGACWDALCRNVRLGDALSVPVSKTTPPGLVGRKGVESAPPLCWREDFAEVFARNPSGFDIVVSNPPYVRQELLDAGCKARSREACRSVFPDARLGGKSDLYAYFYCLGLGMLREGGVLCVISSNSWLDVGFGAPLRALLVRHGRVLTVTESATRPTFRDARVNPAITLVRRCAPESDPDGRVRFVQLRGNLGDERSPAEMGRILRARQFQALPAGRVVPVPQRVLAAAPEAPWGGRYLRAPEVVLELLERCSDRLCRLDALAAVRFGIKTGANDFFYLEPVGKGCAGGGSPPSQRRDDVVRLCRNGAGHIFPIEERFLQPVLRSPREVATPEVTAGSVTGLLFACGASREELADTAALRYIEWGERDLGIHRRASVQGRADWYRVPLVAPPPVLHPLIAFERACAAYNRAGVLCDANLVCITPHDPRHAIGLVACLASSLGVAMRELTGIANLGQGALKTNPAYLARMFVPDLRTVGNDALAALEDAFGAVRGDRFPRLLDGEPPSRWQALDEAVAALLGPAAPSAQALRAAARDLVAARLTRAASLRKRGVSRMPE